MFFQLLDVRKFINPFSWGLLVTEISNAFSLISRMSSRIASQLSSYHPINSCLLYSFS